MMDYKYIEKEFKEFYIHCYGENQEISFYVPTDEHSSGFNKIELYYYEDDNEYSVAEENYSCVDECLNFKEIIHKYPKIILDREYAFYGKFVTWEDIELALKGEKEIDLVRL